MSDSETGLEIVRFVSKTPEQVWTFWTQADELARWWWPERFQTVYQFDAKPGGSYRFKTVNVPPIGVLELTGTFTQVVPPSRLAYTWRWESDLEHESEVHVAFEPHNAGTEVRILHRGLRDSEDRDNHIQGWNDCLDRLAGLQAGSAAY